MDRLTAAQIQYRSERMIENAKGALRNVEIVDRVRVLQNMIDEILPGYTIGSQFRPSDGMRARIKKAIDAGLDKSDPQMVRAAMEFEQEQAGREYLSSLVVQITPYQVADASLARIILEADEDIVEDVRKALAQRDKEDAKIPRRTPL